MIKCPQCRVLYNDKNKICPVCGAKNPTADAGMSLGESNIDLYPKKPVKRHRALDAIHIYTIVAALCVITAGVLNLFFYKSKLWSFEVLIFILYGAFTLINTIDGSSGFSIKIFNQILAANLWFYLTTLVFGGIDIFISYGIPAVFIAANLTQFVLMLYTHGRYRLHYLSTIFIALLGIIPFIVAYFTAHDLIASYVSIGTTIVTVVVALALGGKRLRDEFKGRFRA